VRQVRAFLGKLHPCALPQWMLHLAQVNFHEIDPSVNKPEMIYYLSGGTLNPTHLLSPYSAGNWYLVE